MSERLLGLVKNRSTKKYSKKLNWRQKCVRILCKSTHGEVRTMICEFKYISSDEKNPHDSESSIVFVLAIKINSQWPKVWRKAQTENKAIIGSHRFLSSRASPQGYRVKMSLFGQIGYTYDKVILIFFNFNFKIMKKWPIWPNNDILTRYPCGDARGDQNL